jgi:hypothetical protein
MSQLLALRNELTFLCSELGSSWTSGQGRTNAYGLNGADYVEIRSVAECVSGTFMRFTLDYATEGTDRDLFEVH